MKRPARIVPPILLLVILIASCAQATPVVVPTQTPGATAVPSQMLTPDAQHYLSEALEIIKDHALNSDHLNWQEVRDWAMTQEKDSELPSQTYNTIIAVLQQLDDHHSFFLTPEDANRMSDTTVEDYSSPEGKLLENRLGYVAVFAFNAQEEVEMTKYADKIQNIIHELNGQSVCGWIVDLRENLGGNMYPMIAGLGALLGEGELGFFKDATGQTSTWYYRDGEAGTDNTPITKLSHPDFLLDPDKTPVAVLIGPNTASSGEATAISFRGRPNTRFFGNPSYGLTTGNESFVLSDGAVIILTTVVELDRTGQEYGESIIPDVTTPNPESDASDWLLTQPACAN